MNENKSQNWYVRLCSSTVTNEKNCNGPQLWTIQWMKTTLFTKRPLVKMKNNEINRWTIFDCLERYFTGRSIHKTIMTLLNKTWFEWKWLRTYGLDKNEIWCAHHEDTKTRASRCRQHLPRRLWPPDTIMKIKYLSATAQNWKILEINELCGTESMTWNFYKT
jgi:hypothetical protein